MTEEFDEFDELENEFNEDVLEPICSASEEEIEESGVECEFEDRDGSKFCTTHNCWA